MRLYLRNVPTGEIREVEADSEEFRGLVKEVTPAGLPMWEQTSYAHADAIKDRARTNNLDEPDLGWDDADDLRYAALQLDLEGVAPENNPHLALTPGEIESGLTPRDKLHGLQEMFDKNRVGTRAEVFDRAADRIAEGDREDPREAAPAKGQRARAGGSDEREGVPVASHTDEDEGDASGDSDSGSSASSGSARSRVRSAGQGSGPAPAAAGAGASQTSSSATGGDNS